MVAMLKIIMSPYFGENNLILMNFCPMYRTGTITKQSAKPNNSKI